MMPDPFHKQTPEQEQPDLDFSEQDALIAAAEEMEIDLDQRAAACILLALEGEGWLLTRKRAPTPEQELPPISEPDLWNVRERREEWRRTGKCPACEVRNANGDPLRGCTVCLVCGATAAPTPEQGERKIIDTDNGPWAPRGRASDPQSERCEGDGQLIRPGISGGFPCPGCEDCSGERANVSLTPEQVESLRVAVTFAWEPHHSRLAPILSEARRALRALDPEAPAGGSE